VAERCGDVLADLVLREPRRTLDLLLVVVGPRSIGSSAHVPSASFCRS
jgi:hypothetical protein